MMNFSLIHSKNRLESELSSLDEEIKSLNKITIEKANLDELKERKQIQEVEFSKL